MIELETNKAAGVNLDEFKVRALPSDSTPQLMRGHSYKSLTKQGMCNANLL